MMHNFVERVLQITGTHDHTTKKSENRKTDVKEEIKEEKPETIIS